MTTGGGVARRSIAVLFVMVSLSALGSGPALAAARHLPEIDGELLLKGEDSDDDDEADSGDEDIDRDDETEDETSAESGGEARESTEVTLDGPNPIIVFPVLGAATATDSFGAPRPEGRVHLGVDIFAEKLTPVVAVADGVVVAASTEPGDGCCWLKLSHDEGGESLYLHLNNDTPGTDDGLGWGLAEGVTPGAHIDAGATVGFVGDSGNAEETPPHLHYEYHPSPGLAVDPYPLLVLAKQGAFEVSTVAALPFTGTPAAPLLPIGLLSSFLGGFLAFTYRRTLRLSSDFKIVIVLPDGGEHHYRFDGP